MQQSDIVQQKSARAQPKGVKVLEPEETPATINPRRVSALTIIGCRVKTQEGQHLGKIEEVVLDLTGSVVSYLVLSIGGFAGIGDKFFAIPPDALSLDTMAKTFYLKANRKELLKHRGFDKNNWPEKAFWPIDPADRAA